MLKKDQVINKVISATEIALEALRRRIDVIDQSTDELMIERKRYRAQTTERLLPEVSRNALNKLNIEAPNFVATVIQQNFKVIGKLLGVFKTKKYRLNLSLLQAQLASHLDQIKYGQLKAMDTELSCLALEKNSLNAKTKEASEFLHLLRQARQCNRPLSTAISSRLARISRAQQHSDRAEFLDSNVLIDALDACLLIDYIISENANNELFDALSYYNDVEQSTQQKDLNSDGDIASMGAQAILLQDIACLAGVALEPRQITTDDSLGSFS